MQFAQFTPGPDSARILQVGDIAKVVTKDYGSTFRTHFILVEARGAFGTDSAWIEFTDLQIGSYSPTLSRKILTTDDDFWIGLVPTHMDEAQEAFEKARRGVAQRRMTAEASYHEAVTEDVAYSGLADRMWGAF